MTDRKFIDRIQEAALFLNGIKFQVLGDKKTHTYKFDAGENRYRNVLFHLQDGAGRYLAEALRYALSAKPSKNVQAVLLYIADSNGDQWQVERKGDSSRFTKNRQLIDGDGEEQFKVAIADGDENEMLFDSFEVDYMGQSLFAKRIQKQSPFLQHFQTQGESRLNQHLSECSNFLGARHRISLQDLSKFVSSSKDVYSQWQESRRHLNLLMETYQNVQSVDPRSLDALEQEVDILRALEREAGFLNDPSQSYDVLKDKLKRLDGQLKALCDKHDIHQLSMLEYDVDWDQVISCLGRLQALERLEKSYKKSLNHIEQMVRPIFKDHIRSINGFLTDDKKLLGEIETSLQNITSNYQRLHHKASGEKSEESIFKRLFADKGQEQSIDLEPEILESSRSSVDKVLRSLGAMCSNLELATNNYHSGLDSIQERYEKIVKEMGRERETWRKLSEKYQLDPKTSLRAMLNLVNNLGQISILYGKKKDVKESVMHYRSRLRKLEKIITEWRLLTGSQKSSDLSQPAILISEAKNLLHYQSKKEEQLKKVRKHRNRVDFFQGLKSSYEASLKECAEKWAHQFRILDLQPIELEAKPWKQFYQLVSKCEACGEILSGSAPIIKGGEVFNGKNFEASLNLFHLKLDGEEARHAFTEQLAHISPYVNLLILTDNIECAEDLRKMGLGSSRGIVAKTAAAIGKGPEGTVRVADPSISSKAQAALELFKGRQQQSSFKG